MNIVRIEKPRNVRSSTRWSGLSIAAFCLAGLMLPLLAACGDRQEPPDVSARDVRQETHEAVDTAKDYAKSQMSEVERRVQNALDSVDEQIDEARGDLNGLSEQSRKSLQSTIDRAVEARAEVKAAADEMKKKGQEKMAIASDRLSKALDELAEARTEIGRALAGSKT